MRISVWNYCEFSIYEQTKGVFTDINLTTDTGVR